MLCCSAYTIPCGECYYCKICVGEDKPSYKQLCCYEEPVNLYTYSTGFLLLLIQYLALGFIIVTNELYDKYNFWAYNLLLFICIDLIILVGYSIFCMYSTALNLMYIYSIYNYIILSAYGISILLSYIPFVYNKNINILIGYSILIGILCILYIIKSYRKNNRPSFIEISTNEKIDNNINDKKMDNDENINNNDEKVNYVDIDVSIDRTIDEKVNETNVTVSIDTLTDTSVDSSTKKLYQNESYINFNGEC